MNLVRVLSVPAEHGCAATFSAAAALTPAVLTMAVIFGAALSGLWQGLSLHHPSSGGVSAADLTQ